MTATTDLHRAIVAVWNDNLDEVFKTYWAEADKSVYLTLNEGEASPGTPAPYCIFEQTSSTFVNRMSGTESAAESKRMLGEYLITFRIHTTALTTTEQTAKEIAADLLDALMQSYGGHPTATPKRELMCEYNVLNMQYRNDYSMRTGDNEHLWTIEYAATLDVPYR